MGSVSQPIIMRPKRASPFACASPKFQSLRSSARAREDTWGSNRATGPHFFLSQEASPHNKVRARPRAPKPSISAAARASIDGLTGGPKKSGSFGAFGAAGCLVGRPKVSTRPLARTRRPRIVLLWAACVCGGKDVLRTGKSYAPSLHNPTNSREGSTAGHLPPPRQPRGPASASAQHDDDDAGGATRVRQVRTHASKCR